MKINKTTMATAAGAALLVAAGVASGLAAGGILGKTAEVFMNSTLPHALPTTAWIGIGAGLGGLAMAGVAYKGLSARSRKQGRLLMNQLKNHPIFQGKVKKSEETRAADVKEYEQQQQEFKRAKAHLNDQERRETSEINAQKRRLKIAETRAKSQHQSVLHDIRTTVRKAQVTAENQPELNGPQFDSRGRFLFS